MMPGIPEWTNGDEDVFIYNTEKLEIFPTGLTSSNTQTTDQIIYKRNNKIAVENLAAESLNIYEPVKDGEILNLTVSPDCRKAAFEIIGGDMYVMNIDGTGLTNLGKGYRPSWSPDNNYLVYMITEDDGHRILSSDLYSIKIDGTEKTNLTNTSDNLEMNPDWSPDGKKIAYDVLDERAIYLMVIGE
jgi:Tol biopolymer transport system component